MKVKRYACGQGDGMFEHENGFWIKLSEHKEIVKKLKSKVKILKAKK